MQWQRQRLLSCLLRKFPLSLPCLLGGSVGLHRGESVLKASQLYPGCCLAPQLRSLARTMCPAAVSGATCAWLLSFFHVASWQASVRTYVLLPLRTCVRTTYVSLPSCLLPLAPHLLVGQPVGILVLDFTHLCGGRPGRVERGPRGREWRRRRRASQPVAAGEGGFSPEERKSTVIIVIIAGLLLPSSLARSHAIGPPAPVGPPDVRSAPVSLALPGFLRFSLSLSLSLSLPHAMSEHLRWRGGEEERTTRLLICV